MLFYSLVYILKENGERVVKNLESHSRRVDFLINQGGMLLQDVKKRKIDMMTAIDDNFETVVQKIHRKRAEIKLKLSEALKVEEARIMKEQENF